MAKDMGIDDALRTCESMAKMLAPFAEGADALRALAAREKYSQELERNIGSQQKQLEKIKIDLIEASSDVESLKSTRESEMRRIEADFHSKEATRHQEFAEKGEELLRNLERLKVRNDEVDKKIQEAHEELARIRVEKTSLAGDVADLSRQKEGLKKTIARAAD